MTICTIILAAGTSSRLGYPKQLIKVGNKTLLEKSIEAALGAGSDHNYLVLGAFYDEIYKSIRHMPVKVIENLRFNEGLGSSISTAIKHIVQSENYDGAMFMTCDQLHINPAHLNKLITAFKNKEGLIISTSYNQKEDGVPVIMDKIFFPKLMELSGDSGAKSVIRDYTDHKKTIEFPEATIDLDTVEDLHRAGLKI